MQQNRYYQEIKTILSSEEAPCLSLYLPTPSKGQGYRLGLRQLKHLLQEARERLLQTQLSRPAQQSLLAPIEALPAEIALWNTVSPGLAVFRSATLYRTYHLSYAPPPQVVVGEHFFIKPLLPLLSHNEHFYLLVLSRKQVRLLVCHPFGQHEVPLPENVTSPPGSWRERWSRAHALQYHSGSPLTRHGKRGAVMYHGQGAGEQEQQADELRYIRQIDHAVHALLRSQHAPLVLAAVSSLQALYRHVNTYPFLLKEGLEGNFDEVSAASLRQRAWPLVVSALQEMQQEALARFREREGTGQASGDLSEIARAACGGRIQLLFIAEEATLWGRLDPGTQTVEAHAEAQPDDEDLVDRLAAQTILHDGQVSLVAPAHMPAPGPLAALFRY
ncbi:MAG: hypothetical protein IRZ31_16175 [Thermogemmatispora sp.]|uniref:baeRF3 domain-containing protein n=1 Tax=Thermogemmatispora sp. TaxID=1968838 RepID=UPI00263030E3|nr:hypothetical protein [Thermogemmatispora sp.]MBX5458432.1 hypothetical protein [Thermogemmatispora sp.]